MAITATVNMQLSVLDSLDGEFVDPNASVPVNGLNSTAELSGSTTPPVTKQSAGRVTLVAGAASLDLTSLPDAITGAAAAVTFLGLKVNAYKIVNPSANAITMTFGAANPYLLHGSAFKVIILPGEELQWKGNDLAPDVAAGAKQIDFSGTGTQYLEFHLLAG